MKQVAYRHFRCMREREREKKFLFFISSFVLLKLLRPELFRIKSRILSQPIGQFEKLNFYRNHMKLFPFLWLLLVDASYNRIECILYIYTFMQSYNNAPRINSCHFSFFIRQFERWLLECFVIDPFRLIHVLLFSEKIHSWKSRLFV